MSQPTVLLVTLLDDERAIYGKCLRAEGFDVVFADGPGHALELAASAAPDLVVTRVHPGQPAQGLDLVARLKQEPAFAHLPVIVITSLIQPEYRLQAEAAGCDGYLLLPIVPDVLIAEIRHVLSAASRSIA